MANDNKKKKSIVNAAAGLFSRFGLEKTTMEDIAREAKKGKSSLYYYFESKEQVFSAVINDEIRGLKARIAAAVERVDDPHEKFRLFVGARLEYLGEKAEQYISIKDEYLKHYAFIQNLTVEYSNWEISMIRKIIRYGRDLGYFKVVNLNATSRAIYFALKGLEYPWATNLTRNETEKSVEVLVDILLTGISSK